MKLSILTPSFNQGNFIEKNILSVLNQDYSDYEHIIIDGGSTDNTIEILKKYPHLIWISESDEGQADALNKGLNIATGDIIGWINSDDYYEDHIFDKVVKYFNNLNVQWIIGKTLLYNYENYSTKELSHIQITYKNLLARPGIIRQSGTFFRKNFLLNVGGWNKKYQMAMDYDLWVRLSKQKDPVMVNEILAYFSIHPDQKTSGNKNMLQIKELTSIQIREKAKLKDIIINIIIRLFNTVKFFIKLFLIKIKSIDKKYSTLPFLRK